MSLLDEMGELESEAPEEAALIETALKAARGLSPAQRDALIRACEADLRHRAAASLQEGAEPPTECFLERRVNWMVARALRARGLISESSHRLTREGERVARAAWADRYSLELSEYESSLQEQWEPVISALCEGSPLAARHGAAGCAVLHTLLVEAWKSCECGPGPAWPCLHRSLLRTLEEFPDRLFESESRVSS